MSGSPWTAPHVPRGSTAIAETLVERLRAHACERPDKRLYTFLDEEGGEAGRLTFAQLDLRVRAVAARLQELGAAGERALLLFPPGLGFVEAFLGCLYAGAIAVPVPPPGSGRRVERLRPLVADAEPRLVLAPGALAHGAARRRLATLPGLDAASWVATDELADDLAALWRDPGLPGEAIAFLQYTSGSTSTPKGVMVSHSNLAFMERLIQSAFEQDESSVVAGWLPVYHDMGLIGNILQPLYLGASCVLMSPVAFLRRPRRWLEAISKYRATTSGGPNFAYELCVRRIGEEERRGLDLSTWRVAFNGAEPVRAATLERFAEAFAAYGFRADAFQPCYGLAEATLLVSGTRSGPGQGPRVLTVEAAEIETGRVVEVDDEGPSRSRALVSCGRVPDGVRVAVVEPESLRPCAPGEVGEIWVAGPGVAGGYWRRPEATRETFAARLPDGGEPWLRTGDLGFAAGGEAFVTGRLKDLVILRGRNLYPQDVELTVEASAPGLASGGGAAFSIDAGGEERLVVAQEVEPRAVPDRTEVEALAAAIRRAVAEEHEVQVHEVVLLRPGALPRTTSGKVRRQACRRLYLEEALEALGRSRLGSEAEAEAGVRLDSRLLQALGPAERREAIEPWLRQRAAAVLGVPLAELRPDRPLLALGLDSLAAIELAQAVEAELGVALPLSAVLEGAGPAAVADRLAEDLAPGPLAAHPLPSRRAQEREELPVSWGERGLWFLDRLAPGNAAYHLAGAARVVGGVAAEALRAAFQAFADRHEALRTTFAEHGGEPVRKVHERLEIGFEEFDARAWTEQDFLDRLQQEAWRPFNLAQGPLLRMALFARPEGARVLLFVVHHVVCDFWSLGLLVREVGAFLAGEAAGAAAPSASAFARWQAEHLARTAGERLQEFWSDRLADLAALDLPLDRPRRALRSGRAGCRWREFGPDLTDRLRALARERGMTLYTVLLAAFQALLHRLTGQTDLAVGSPAAGRPAGLPGAAETVGYFANPLVLRGDLAGDPSFGELMGRTRRSVLEALDHQVFPLALLTERLRSGGDFFRAMFVHHRPPAGLEGLSSFALGEPGGRLRLGPVKLESLRLSRKDAQFEITLTVGERRGGLGVELTYYAELLDGTTAERWLEHLAAFLAAVAATPEVRIGDLPLLADAERHQILIEANDTRAAAAPWPTLHEAHAQQAAQTPDAVALVWDMERLTYGELDGRADLLAHRLRELGAGPERVVAVRLPRTPDLVVALLAVLKAGAAYLPLDPAYPEERQALMLEDAGAELVIVADDFNGSDVARRPGPHALGPREGLCAGPGNLAYLIYTSGSTGRPKAVAIEHASAVRLLAWAGEVFEPEELAGVFASTSVSFDLSVFELFVPLAHGGTVILAENALALPSLPAAGEVTLLNTVPSAASALLDLAPLRPGLRTVNLAGEPLQRSLADRLYAAGAARVLDLYGPSEDTTYSTFARVEREAEGPPAIGRPISGSQAYVVDREIRPVPLGVTGELCLGGEGLGRGYLGRPERTAERFVPDPFGAPGARLYRTGDLARRLPSGELDYLGRIDRQVKIRGFRIEPGEVEAALLAHPWAREAAVAVRDGSLVAYVAAAPEAPERPQPALRAFLAGKLPAALVPSAVVVLPALPLTPNGKLDRAALPAPDGDGGAGFAAPRGPVEELLAAIWADLLGVPEVGRDDSFFDLHGHSLLAARVVARVREALGVDLPLTAPFEAPRLADLARRIEVARRGETRPVRRVSRDGPLPLSFAQRRLWLLDRLEPGKAAYNLPLGLRLRGPLDAAALARAFTELVRRHEVLRTAFPEGAEGPVLRIAPAGPVPLPCVDLSGLPASVAQAAAGRLARAEAGRPFDLARGPVLRVLWLRCGSEDHDVLITLHHIAADYWSLGLLLAELGVLYSHPTAVLPEPPVQHGDYAAWERDAGVREDLLAWWRERLQGTPALDLPSDRPRPAVRSSRGATLPVRLSQELAAGLATLGRRRGATPFIALLAAFAALLHRYTGQRDLAIGTAVANRDRVELERVIGPFVNTLVLRTDVEDGQSFAGLLERVRRVALDAYLRRDVPFERLVEELRLHRDLSRQALAEVMLVLHNAPFPAPRLAGLQVQPRSVDADTAQSDLALSLAETGSGLEGSVEFSTDLFEPSTVRRMVSHFETLLQGAVRDPEIPVSGLPLVSEFERHQILCEWSASLGPEDVPDVTRRFECQVALTPTAVALEAGDIRVTYGELGARAGPLARRLRKCGVGPEVTVALEGRRAPEMVVAVLAVLKAGGAYVPVDPAWPQERRQRVLEDARPAVVLSLGESSPADAEPERLHISLRSVDSSPASAGSGLDREIDPDHPAYVLYTSGSTGRPKGVVGRRGSLSNYLVGAGKDYALDPEDRMLQFASLSFDTGTEETLCPLLFGATLVLRDDAMIGSIRDFLAVCERLRITVLDLPTAFWHELAMRLDEEGLALPRALRLVIVGGEAVRPAALAAWQKAARPGVRLINSYGPTEATIGATAYELGPAASALGEVPIGRPVFGAIARVLSPTLEPVPIGVPGELFLGGPGLARGYLGRPDLTAERFLPDPWGAAGERLYRTGDRARHLPGGDLEYLGRTDHQLKVRGYRVEPGEIEAALVEHPGVRTAVVDAPEIGPGDRQLVAWVVARDAGVPSDLRDFLRARLPEYMVPARYVPLAELPLTPSGKVDRSRLPDPPQESAPATAAGGDPIREIVAGIWAELLGRESVGPDEDFFELGGHSLLATRVLSRLHRAFGIELPLLALFEAPTVSSLSRRIAAALGAAPGPDAGPVPVSAAAEAPLSPPQERLWFLDRLQGGSPFYNLAGAVELSGDLDIPALARSLQEVVRRHGALRTTIRQRGEDPVQVVAPELRLPLSVVDLSSLPGETAGLEARRLAAAESRRPFDLEHGPLLRATLLRTNGRGSLGAVGSAQRLAAPPGAHTKERSGVQRAQGGGTHHLLLTLHHIVGDAWSLALLTSELAACYGAFTRGASATLPEPPLQYADFARWQRERQSSDAFEDRLAHWRRRLAGLTNLELPTDFPRPPVQTFHGAVERFSLPADLIERLQALGRSRDATLFMVLLAGFAALLHRLSGQTDVAVGTDIANRDRLETEGVIGFFVNSLVLRTDVSGNPTFAELLDRVRTRTLEDYAHQDVPFHKVVEALRPVRDPSRNPLFQVMFILQNAPAPRFDLPGLAVSFLDLAESSSVFDLSFSLEEDGARGLAGSVRFNTDLFAAATVRRMIERWSLLLRDAAARPEARLDALAAEAPDERERRIMETTRRKESKFEKLAAAKPKAIRVTQEELVRASPLLGEGRPPLRVEPNADAVELIAWGAAHRAQVEEWLARHGGVLFRGFELGSLSRFQQFVAAVSSGLIKYGERSSPRSALEGEVYTSTDHPEDQPIVLHNEQSYTLNWPMKIAFFCVQPALQGGRTPLADSRRIYARLSPAVRERFERLGVLYVRNYGDGLGLPWREAFQAGDRAEVERYCREAGLELQWKDGDRLRTRQVRPAVRRHPHTGEPVWFNHALFFHVSSLEPATRDALLAGLAPEDLPFNSYYGDGTPIEPEVLAEVRAAFDAETVSFPWQEGDVLLLDNMLTAHGREPFSGPRRIAVAMADPYAAMAAPAGSGAD